MIDFARNAIGKLKAKSLNCARMQYNNLLFNWASNNIKPAITIFTETVLLKSIYYFIHRKR